MATQQATRMENVENTNEESERPASLIALEEQFTPEQIQTLRRVAAVLAATTVKIAREQGILK